MSDFTFIVFARAIHVLAGVVWAGTSFALALAVLPLMRQYGKEGAGRWLGMVARRAAMFSGISAVLTVLSGIYLFHTLHANDASSSAMVLKAGAAAALLSLALGLVVARPTTQKLVQLQQQEAKDEATLRQLAGLQQRVSLTASLIAALLAASVLAMGTFRYVSV